MIIECINCSKKFEVNSDLIPNDGRSIQCGSCNHIWFFNKNDNFEDELKIKTPKKVSPQPIENPIFDNISDEKLSSKDVIKKIRKSKVKDKSAFTVSRFLSYILVLIISFVGLIVIIDTFKSPLFNFFPDLELIFYNLFETLKDINLFIKDLI